MTERSSNLDHIAAVILAGGDGTRLGLGTKALVRVAGQTLIDRTLTNLRSQTNQIAINVRAPEDWANARGYPVVCDSIVGVGPLAGVLASMTWAHNNSKTAYVLTTPVDCPFLPSDLVVRLMAAISDDVEIAVAASAGRTHHLIALWRAQLSEHLLSELHSRGPIPVHQFQAHYRSVTVSWTVDSRDPFFNINTKDELARAEALMR